MQNDRVSANSGYLWFYLAILSIAYVASGGVDIAESKFRQWCLGGHPDGIAACEAYASATHKKYGYYGWFHEPNLSISDNLTIGRDGRLREICVYLLRIVMHSDAN
jgi:hypothetical protein